jgi:hypothetical protein
MNKLTLRLNFQQASEILGVVPDDVRSLVVEERRIPAVYITQVALSAEPYNYQLLKVDSEGRAFDLTVGGMEGTVHTGFLRIERVALEKFMHDEGLALNKVWTPEKLAEESSLSQALECGPVASSVSPVMLDSANTATPPDPERRLARLRALGGNATCRRDEWKFTGIAALVASEKSEGRKRCDEKTIRADLKNAADNESDAKRAGFADGLGQR